VESGSELGQELKGWFGTDTHSLDLSVGALYVVYAVEITRGWVRYFVADDAFSSTLYPFGYSASFFEVVDSRVSRCWSIGCRGLDSAGSEVVFSFKEWATEETFYERLVDRADQEQGTFRVWKEFMDLEFPNPSIVDGAEVLDGGWLLCPKCSEAWESQGSEGMTRCPKCRALLSNPFFMAGE
jgi:hypothetical protein